MRRGESDRGHFGGSTLEHERAHVARTILAASELDSDGHLRSRPEPACRPRERTVTKHARGFVGIFRPVAIEDEGGLVSGGWR